MALTRQANLLGQQRVDVPDLRSIESAVANDFDLLAGVVMTAKESLVVKGFTIDTSSAFGAAASALVLQTAGGIMIHWGATEAGSLIQVPDDRPDEILNTSNPRVQGSFASNAMNYVGIDYLRSADASTADTTKFMTADTGQEVARSVPKARTLDYRIVITTSPFSLTTNVDPVAKVLTDTSGNVVSVTDARNMLGRLAPGGDVPNPAAAYTWADTGRRENENTYAPPTTTDNPFQGGDKGILSLKDWMDAIMNTMWEAKSGQFWYSPTTRDGIKLGCTSTVFVGTGDNFDWTSPPTLKWTGLIITFENSDVNHNVVADNTGGSTVNDGQCVYADIDRTTVATITAQVGTLTSLPTPTVPGSRVIIAWRIGSDMFIRDRGFDITRTIPTATTSINGIVRLNVTPASSSAPQVLTVGVNGAVTTSAFSGNTTGITSTGFGTGAGLAGTGGGTNANGVFGQGTGTNNGLQGIGGPTGGAGVAGTGGTSNGNGVFGTGTGTATGVHGVGGSSNGDGVRGVGGATNGLGVHGLGTGGGSGGLFVGGGSGGVGVTATGNGAAAGVAATGGATGPGVTGNGGASAGSGGVFTGGGGGGSTGVVGVGGGTSGGPGGSFTGGQNGNGVTAQGGLGNSNGVVATATGTGLGLSATGGGTSGIGVRGTGGAGNGTGVVGLGTGTAPGGDFDGQGNGAAATDDAILSHQNIHLSGSNPGATTGFTNRLTAKNICKAWGIFQTNGSGGVTLLDGFNVASVSVSGGTIRVSMASGISSTNYSVLSMANLFVAFPTILSATDFNMAYKDITNIKCIVFDPGGSGTLQSDNNFAHSADPASFSFIGWFEVYGAQ